MEKEVVSNDMKQVHLQQQHYQFSFLQMTLLMTIIPMVITPTQSYEALHIHVVPNKWLLVNIYYTTQASLLLIHSW